VDREPGAFIKMEAGIQAGGVEAILVSSTDKGVALKRRLGILFASLMLVGSLQVVAAPVASACADPNCPWSPITDYVSRLIHEVDRICDETTEPGCPL
jgi:hypothetical protein